MTALQPPPPVAQGARERRRLEVSGVVQGVGFRPFVWTLARRLGVSGSVCNTSGAVVVEAEAERDVLDAFVLAVAREAPGLARVDGVVQAALPVVGGQGFVIRESQPVDGAYQPIAADAATCDACLAELWNPRDRRYRYPFINCTGCGPRFTIIEDVPYDRATTTMRVFAMCEQCAAEYADPSSRRFHAQPNACPACGPRAWFADGQGREVEGDAVGASAAALRRGEVVAVKGLGGFQLAVLASDERAVRTLRQRKHRPDKPFAVMVADLDQARALARVGEVEAAGLLTAARPIMLLRARRGALAAPVAPGLDEVGLMLPSTPLHHLLLREVGRPLVMTSGNLTDEPIARENLEAVQRLGGIADGFLLHDRDIWARYDDSVVRVADGVTRVIRRARGLCPLPITTGTPPASPPVLALGAHLKNTFCILRDGRAFVGPHIGDLDHPVAIAHHREALATYLRLFRTTPAAVTADLHPSYTSTQLAEQWWLQGAQPARVQHHHAHIASVMAEHALRGRVLGVAFDGTGFGEDGTVWGGEFLLCDETSFTRVGHLAAVTQPGGDRCAREGWRMTAAYLHAIGRDTSEPPPWMTGEAAPDARAWRLVGRVAAAGGVNAPTSTSAGRLFDAVASILGVAQTSSFEAAAAMRLEALARTASAEVIGVHLGHTEGGVILDSHALVAEIVDRRAAGADPAVLAAGFHESLAAAVAQACAALAETHGVSRVALSGGVFQNALLLERTASRLRGLRLEVLLNRDVPANDGGVSLGQAWVTAWRLDPARAAVA